MDEQHGSVTAELDIIKTPPDAVQPSSNAFFLEQALGYDADRSTIIEKTVECYPPDLLTSDANLYVIVDVGRRYHYTGGILTARTKSFLRHGTLDEFVRATEAAGKGIVVVSFGQDDFNRFSAVVGQRPMWSIPETHHQGSLYQVHKYGSPRGRIR